MIDCEVPWVDYAVIKVDSVEFEPEVGQHAEVGVVEYTLKTMAG